LKDIGGRGSGQGSGIDARWNGLEERDERNHFIDV
jgi:hypothetical protein